MPSRQSPSSQRTPPRSLPRATSSAVATDTSWRATSRSQRPSRTRSSRTRALQVEHPTFIKTFTRFIEVVAPKLHEEWVASQLDDSSMRALVTSGYTFQNFNCALYATDVAFQQGIAPSGSKAEVMPFYSANHKLYGFKIEVSVNPRTWQYGGHHSVPQQRSIPPICSP
ncbi:hypothetical protein PC128_g23883 [Phytophthora cactorum]|nr:hypothetical protein PC120_g22865 [Phytophthora cactorum]KAG3084190.1 hypothetical protein PC121_g5457 [Phytophthora cactorum]KAG3147044.1 hypothetical protein PC128_g23883 [Phytophthora cactorum]KAG4050739.1 hypothetical protein PC123_g14025 [Phytophthora cactorum]